MNDVDRRAGAEIKRLRLAKGLNPIDIASVGIGPIAVLNIEAGTYSMTLPEAYQLVTLLGGDLRSFLEVAFAVEAPAETA